MYPVYYGNITKKYKLQCFNKNEKNPGVYFDAKDEVFKPCYEACYECSSEGNKSFHNCISCEPGYRFKPEHSPKNNCVADCPYYYYTAYQQYKCIDELPCPKEAKLLIKEENKCISDCKSDKTYIYQYNGICYAQCPKGTKNNNNNNICEDENVGVCALTQNDIDLDYKTFIDKIDIFVEIFSDEYSYTKKHITEYKNSEYDSIIYKDKNCINELSLKYPIIDFGICYDKVKNNSNIKEDLIVVIINKIIENNNGITSYSFFHPITGLKLNIEVCQKEKIKLSENLLSLLKENNTNYELMISLIKQGVNIFNSSDQFYKDICYKYDLETDNDIAFQNRAKLFYPNISLCDSECSLPSINFEKLTFNCECNFNDISNTKNFNDTFPFKEDELFDILLGDVIEYIGSTNIAVLKCFKKAIKNFEKYYGFYLTLILLLINIIFTIILCYKDFDKIKLYIYKKTQNYLKLFDSSTFIPKEPPKKTNVIKNNNSNDYEINEYNNSITQKIKKIVRRTKKTTKQKKIVK